MLEDLAVWVLLVWRLMSLTIPRQHANCNYTGSYVKEPLIKGTLKDNTLPTKLQRYP